MALDPNKIALCWPNYIDTAVVSGGAWVPTLPLEHVKDARFSVVAKTASLDPIDTQFSITLPKRQRLHALAIPAHNMSSTATLRARVYRDAGQTDLILDTGWQDVWPVLYGLDDVVWGNDNFWNRRLAEDDRQNYTPLAIVFFEERLLGSSMHVELRDTANTDGAIVMGRVMVTDVWQPRKNLDHGVQHGYDTGTQITWAGDPSRTGYARRVTPKRTVTFDLNNLNEDEAFLRIHRLQRTQDIVGEILYLWSPVPSPINFARAMIAQQTELNGITYPYYANYEHAMSLLEIL
ncbi:hypothetical protein SAMN04487867_12969 [Vreelandella titanicae]|uniref:hypothetical protein n=1 Tax=Vreelandella titanicae TaxID=664683 RepID=UPI000883152F|nr:hypothetical protein [Halomonas titanicae]SDJ24210.1 hypothetical protein SAMN04487867_12969 [Halomonas titanicae]